MLNNYILKLIDNIDVDTMTIVPSTIILKAINSVSRNQI